jgi:hypothetical protein
MAFNRGPGGSQSGSSEIEDTPVTIAQGGTSATTAVQARANLGIGTMGTQPSNSVDITGGSITGISPLPVSSGGTGASGQAQARTNLGIASAATQATEFFATAAQGALADTAVQPADIGTAAAEDVGYFATAAQGALADSAVQPGDLATVATSGDYTDLSNKPTIPANLDDLGDVVITTPSNSQILSYNGTNWVNVNAGSGSGDVVGPASAVDSGVALFDGTTGKLIKDGGVLGTAAFTATGDYATAAQGALADTATQPGDLATVATSGDYTDLINKPTLGTAAATDSTDYATAAQGALADTALQSFTETDPVVGAITGIVKADGAGVISAAVSGTDYATGAQGSLADSAVQPGDNISTLTNDAGFTTNTGTVTSVDATVPTGLAVSGNPITTSGTLAFTYASGYAIPTTTKQSNWDDSYTFTSNFPSQTSQSGKYLTTDGSVLSWATVDALPSQTGNSGKFLTTDGTDASWATLPPGGQYLGTATTKAIMYNAQSIAENITIDGTYNALSAGPITIDSTYTVTVSSGAVWTIV